MKIVRLDVYDEFWFHPGIDADLFSNPGITAKECRCERSFLICFDEQTA